MVVWESIDSAGSDTDNSIQAQRYDSNGDTVGSEFQINTYTTHAPTKPKVAIDSDGDFVVVWQSLESAGPDTFPHSIQGQRFNASGSAIGSQFQVNTYTTATQARPSVGTPTSRQSCKQLILLERETGLEPATPTLARRCWG